MRRALVLCLLAGVLLAQPAGAQPAPAAGTQPATKIRWLALGDSYSSGEGVYGAGNGQFTDWHDPCSRSQHAWARQAARWVESISDPKVQQVFKLFGKYVGGDVPRNIPNYDVDMTFLACSGAETTEAGAAQDLDEQLAQANGLYDVITFSFGGNDAKFSPVIIGCINPANGYGCDESESTTVSRIRDEVGPKLDVAYRKIRQRLAPGGRVIVNGYPRLFDKPTFRATCFGLIPRWDIEMLRRVADALNNTIKDRAAANGIDYVDIATPFEGRNACGTGFGTGVSPNDLVKWAAKEFVPLEFTSACLAMKWVNGISIGKEVWFRYQHSFHPNLCGHVVEGLLVAKRILDWKAPGEQPTGVDLFHGGLAVRMGEHEVLHYPFESPVAPIVDHMTKLFGLPGPGDAVPVDPGACGLADGMTWQANGAKVLTICVRGDRFIGFIQHDANPGITTRDGVKSGAKVWRLLASSGGELSYTAESKRIGGTVVVTHSYYRCDVTEFGDPPQEGRLGSPDDWNSEIAEVWDIAGSIDTCASPPPLGPEPVPAEQYNQGLFYFFTSPDGNYQCGIASDGALCQGETQPVPPKPASCREGWGYGMGVDETGKVDFVCAGGLIYGPSGRNPDDRDKLPSGKSITALGFTCSADDTGIRCVHDASKHGFAIAPTTNDQF